MVHVWKVQAGMASVDKQQLSLLLVAIVITGSYYYLLPS